jgi:two-component system, LytTR family, sensor kinase
MFRIHRISTIVFHVCIWTLLFLCIVLWRPRNPEIHRIQFSNVQFILSGLPFMGLFYLHAYWLIPNYLFRKRFVLYISAVLISSVTVVLLSGWLLFMGNDSMVESHNFLFPPRRVFPALFILMASASLGAFRENFKLEKRRKEKETEHLRSELSLLRSQVNPHFMLNVLNSMALLARRKSEQLEPVLTKLADLMNYMLYNTDNKAISLEDEINYVRAYIDLQLLRFGNDVTVEFNTPEMLGEKYIESMLLIPLVENAFKHGIGLVDSPIIFIDIRIEKGEMFVMTVKNKYNRSIQNQVDNVTGIGLKNLKKRLALLYPGRFELNILDNWNARTYVIDNWFIITLIIPLR